VGGMQGLYKNKKIINQNFKKMTGTPTGVK
jgi:hypothetical protein